MYEWLIIGGGVQGTALSYALHRVKGIPQARLGVLDPHPQPLARWHATTRNTGMAYLRSPEVHHLHYDPWSIRTFAQTRQGQPHARYLPLYNRPSLALFNAHSEWLISKYGLAGMRLQGRAQGLNYNGLCWQVETDQGRIESKNVVLALNNTEAPQWPAWAQRLKAAGGPVNHLFDLDFSPSALPPWGHAVVIGGGISAAQCALSMSQQRTGALTLLTRHALRISHFDSDPCWVTNLCLKDFHKLKDFDQRRRLIHEARQGGSLPPDVAQELKQAESAGHLRVQFGEVQAATLPPDQGLVLHLHDGASLQADRVILATGFEAGRPGGAWLDAAIESLGLPVAACGYPMIDAQLRWHAGLYVVGRLAELEIGPVAANIIGARLAATRLIKA